MVRLSSVPPSIQLALEQLECPRYREKPWVQGAPLANRRVALISTAGLQQRHDRPFSPGADDYRIIDADVPSADIVMSHISTNFDRTGFQSDINVAFPIDRLRELERDGTIDSVADYHYSFMGATDPEMMAPQVDVLAPLLHRDSVDAVLLAPV